MKKSGIICACLAAVLALATQARRANGGPSGRTSNGLTKEEASRLVEGVHKIGAPDAVPGPLVVNSNWTLIATCPYSTVAEGHAPAVFAAARRFGKGRVFAMGHEWHFGQPGLGMEDNEQFARNVFRWLDPVGSRKICVRQTEWSFGLEGGIVMKLQAEGWTVRRVSTETELTREHLANISVLVYSDRWGMITDGEKQVVLNFIRGGGAALLNGLGWSYQRYMMMMPGSLEAFPMNQIGRELGLKFEAGFLNDPRNNYNGDSRQPVITNLYPQTAAALEAEE